MDTGRFQERFLFSNNRSSSWSPPPSPAPAGGTRAPTPAPATGPPTTTSSLPVREDWPSCSSKQVDSKFKRKTFSLNVKHFQRLSNSEHWRWWVLFSPSPQLLHPANSLIKDFCKSSQLFQDHKTQINFPIISVSFQSSQLPSITCRWWLTSEKKDKNLISKLDFNKKTNKKKDSLSITDHCWAEDVT